MMYCFRTILQIWIILIGFWDTNDFVNLRICKHEFEFTAAVYYFVPIATKIKMIVYYWKSKSDVQTTIWNNTVWLLLQVVSSFEEKLVIHSSYCEKTIFFNKG